MLFRCSAGNSEKKYYIVSRHLRAQQAPMPLFENERCHGGGLNEFIPICKTKNLMKLTAIIPELVKMDINNPSCGENLIEPFASALKLKFVVNDLGKMTDEAWLEENMPAIKNSLASLPDPRNGFRGYIPYIVVQAHELCVCLVEFYAILLCEKTLVRRVDTARGWPVWSLSAGYPVDQHDKWSVWTRSSQLDLSELESFLQSA